MNWIITDIEGTTSSIDFVHRTLFPYARKHLSHFLHTHRGDKEIEEVLQQLWIEDLKNSPKEEIELGTLVDMLQRWIQEDRKHPLLKLVQGKIWRDGYSLGHYKGHVYDDVPLCLKAWTEEGIKLGIYSSGSIEAQKLLFAHTEYGDLTPYFRLYFDTGIGHKRETHSYLRIADSCGGDPQQILFLSDIAEELDAAHDAGLRTCQLLRAGTIPSSRHAQAKTFFEVGTLVDSLGSERT